MKQKCFCDKCAVCKLRQRYRKRRAEGLPAWAATGRTADGWVKNQALKNQWNKDHRELMRAIGRKLDEKNRQLYGGNPTMSTLARARWLDHKANLKRQANG